MTVTVLDDASGMGTQTATVRVESSAAAMGALGQAVSDLRTHGDISRGEASAFGATIDAATRALARGDVAAATGSLGAFINQVQAAVQAGRLSASAGATLIALAQRILAALGPQ